MQQNEQVYKCADPARQKMHWFQEKKKLQGHINNDSYWTESEYKRMDFFLKKIALNL